MIHLIIYLNNQLQLIPTEIGQLLNLNETLFV